MSEVKKDDYGAQLVKGDNLAVRWAVDAGDSTITYVGESIIGTATSVAKWKVLKADATNGRVSYAVVGLPYTWKYNSIWDDRESLDYQ